MAKETLTPAQQALLSQAQQARTLLDSGMTKDELTTRLIETGMSTETAKVVIEIAENLKKQNQKAGAMAIGILAAAILIPAGLVWLFVSSSGPNDYQRAQEVVTRVEGVCTAMPTDPSVEVITHNGEQVLLIGAYSGRSDAIRSSNDELFVDTVMRDDVVAIDRAICVRSSDDRPTIVCDGYYSEEVIEALEQAGSPEEALALLDRDDPLFQVWVGELVGEGSTLQVEGIEVSATMHHIPSGSVLSQADHLRTPGCPDSHTETSYGGRPGRTSVQPDDIEAILTQLT